MAERLEGVLAVVAAHAALTHTAKVQIGVNHVENAVVHRNASRVRSKNDILHLGALLGEHVPTTSTRSSASNKERGFSRALQRSTACW